MIIIIMILAYTSLLWFISVGYALVLRCYFMAVALSLMSSISFLHWRIHIEGGHFELMDKLLSRFLVICSIIMIFYYDLPPSAYFLCATTCFLYFHSMVSGKRDSFKIYHIFFHISTTFYTSLMVYLLRNTNPIEEFIVAFPKLF